MGDLARHFTYGRQTWPGILEPDSEIYYSGPRRQRELIRLSHAQIETQKECARGIARSNLHAAEIVANEVQRQTAALETALGTMTGTLSNDIQTAASQITDSIVDLGQQLSVELSEIRWQLAQQQETMERILSVLTNSRNNEAQQLVKQGLRHYQNDQYREAEERFRKALEFDTTDYQVLMNLAYIEVHKDNAPTAVDYFHRALILPEQSDAVSRFRAMWGMARVHYATGEFALALKGALTAIKELEKNHETINPVDLVTAAGYAAQSGNKQDALELILRAVKTKPTLFAKVAAEKDLQPMQQEVLEVLSDLARTTYEQSDDALRRAENKASSLKETKMAPECSQAVTAAGARLMSLRQQLKSPSYSGCLEALKAISVVNDLLFHVEKLRNALEEQSLAHAQTQTQEKLKSKAENTVTEHGQSVEQRKSLANMISGIITAIVVLYCIISLVSSVKSASNIDERGSAAFAILTSWIWIPVCGVVAFFVPRFLLRIMFGTWWKGGRVKEAEENRYSLGSELGSAKNKEAEATRRVEALQKQVKALLSSI